MRRNRLAAYFRAKARTAGSAPTPWESQKIVKIKGFKPLLFSRPFASVHPAWGMATFCCIDGHWGNSGGVSVRTEIVRHATRVQHGFSKALTKVPQGEVLP